MSSFFSKNSKRVILFDLNGTLIDEKLSRKAAFVETLNQYTGRWTQNNPSSNPKKVFVQFEKELQKLRKKNPSAPLHKLRLSALKTALQDYPISADRYFADAFFRSIADYSKQQFHLFPDAEQTLHQLSPHYDLRIISNSRGYNISKSPLGAYFSDQSIFTPDKAGSRKPNPRFYQAALKAWQLRPEACVMIGNSWKNDIVGAAKAGIDGIWIRKKQKNKLAYRKINRKKVIAVRSLHQIPNLLT